MLDAVICKDKSMQKVKKTDSIHKHSWQCKHLCNTSFQQKIMQKMGRTWVLTLLMLWILAVAVYIGQINRGGQKMGYVHICPMWWCHKMLSAESRKNNMKYRKTMISYHTMLRDACRCYLLLVDESAILKNWLCFEISAIARKSGRKVEHGDRGNNTTNPDSSLVNTTINHRWKEGCGQIIRNL